MNIPTHAPEQYKDHFTEYLLCLALDVGEGMLKNGGEVGRVENTVERICRAYGATHIEVFSIISVIHAAIRMPDGSYSSQMRRIRQTGTDLYKVELYNEISRKICSEKPPLEVFEGYIQEAKKKNVYPKWITIPASATAASAFAVFFGGGMAEGVIAAWIGALIALINLFTSNRINELARAVIASFTAGILSSVSAHLINGAQGSVIMIGTIMLLVPGVAFGTALRDLLCGDLLAGSLKIVQSVLAALMIAFGYLVSMTVMGGVW